MKQAKKIIITVLVVIAVCFCILVGVKIERERAGQASKVTELKIGDEVPDFSIELLDGSTFHLSEHRGEVIFINLWATFCKPCVIELPDIQKLSENYPEATILTIASGDKKSDLEKFMESNAYDFMVGVDLEENICTNVIPTQGIPYTIIVDENGCVVYKNIGARENMYEEYEPAITEALGL